MLQDFVKKKFSDYRQLVEFSGGNTSLRKIRQSGLPAFIINFYECSLNSAEAPVDKKEFDEILNRAVIFNVNYIIKPKNTILKFLFGEVETRPVEFIRARLGYFQFYGYYINHIDDFITMNSLEVVSINQIEHIIDDINSKLLEEINEPANGDSERLNLVKLLYYFFVDLTVNNPINIKLPKKVLSVFLSDKGFHLIKLKVDRFFSDEIFIQEAIELMKPGAVKTAREKTDVSMTEKEVKELISKAKTKLIDKDTSNKEVAKILEADENLPDVDKLPDVKILREQETKMPENEPRTLVIDEEIYSNDLLFAAEFEAIAPASAPDKKQVMEKLIYELFCEETYKKRILKKLFNKDEALFTESVVKILEPGSWSEAIPEIEKLFKKNKIDFYCEEAVKFVDILQSHFTKTTHYSSQKQGT
jgi:hypothetical protein